MNHAIDPPFIDNIMKRIVRVFGPSTLSPDDVAMLYHRQWRYQAQDPSGRINSLCPEVDAFLGRFPSDYIEEREVMRKSFLGARPQPPFKPLSKGDNDGATFLM